MQLCNIHFVLLNVRSTLTGKNLLPLEQIVLFKRADPFCWKDYVHVCHPGKLSKTHKSCFPVLKWPKTGNVHIYCNGNPDDQNCLGLLWDEN